MTYRDNMAIQSFISLQPVVWFGDFPNILNMYWNGFLLHTEHQNTP